MLTVLAHLILFAVFCFVAFAATAVFLTNYFAKRNPSAALYWANVLRRLLNC